MANPFKNPRFMMTLSILLGIASAGIAAYGLYKKEYVIGAALPTTVPGKTGAERNAFHGKNENRHL